MTHGSETRARTSHITIRLTPREREIIDAFAERAGLRAGSYVRATLLGAPQPRQVRRPPIERRELSRLLGEVGRVGNNINQIARSLNGGGAVEDAVIAEALAELTAVRAAILTALGRVP